MEQRQHTIGYVESGGLFLSVHQHFYEEPGKDVREELEIILHENDRSGNHLLPVLAVPDFLKGLQRALWIVKEYAPAQVSVDLERLRLVAADAAMKK